MADIINNGVPTPIQIYGRAPSGQLQAVTTDGLGNISFAGAGGTPGGSNTQIQYNNNGVFGGIPWTVSGNNILVTNNASTLGITSGGPTIQFGNNLIFSTYGGNTIQANNPVIAPAYLTTTNCSSSASPAVCGSAAAGSIVIAATATSVQVNTTAVTANSQIFVQEDDSLGARLSVTCNTQTIAAVGAPEVTARTAGSNFTISITTGPTTNPACYSYFIVN